MGLPRSNFSNFALQQAHVCSFRSLIGAGKVLDVSIVLGANANDANLFVLPQYPKGLSSAEFVRTVQDLLPEGVGPDIISRVFSFYPPSENRRKNVLQIGTLTTDRRVINFVIRGNADR